jgi:SAM-dependent methyltransferase
VWDVDAGVWDERYRDSDLVWGAAPNVFVAAECTDLAAGRALDLACGEGRNALWLAAHGWRVTAVDFSAVALEKGHRLESAIGAPHPIAWVQADATRYRHTPAVELALLCYLQLATAQRRAAVRLAAGALAPGGVLLVIAHDSTNLTDGTGGPQDPAVLYTAADVVADLAGCGLQVDRADAVRRPVDGADRPAIDVLVRAHRPG